MLQEQGRYMLLLERDPHQGTIRLTSGEVHMYLYNNEPILREYYYWPGIWMD